MKRKSNPNLWEAMKDNKVTGLDLGKISGVHNSLISRFVNGNMIPSEIQKIKIARALNRKVNDIFPTN